MTRLGMGRKDSGLLSIGFVTIGYLGAFLESTSFPLLRGLGRGRFSRNLDFWEISSCLIIKLNETNETVQGCLITVSHYSLKHGTPCLRFAVNCQKQQYLPRNTKTIQ